MKKTIFVSGGSKRIGKSICEYFHKNDFNIICHFNNSEKEAENLKDQLNTERENSCEIIQYDLNDIDGINSFCNEVKDIFGRLDVLVNNASTFYSDDLEINEGSNWNDLINSNVKAPYYLVSNLKSIGSTKSIITSNDKNKSSKNNTIISSTAEHRNYLIKTIKIAKEEIIISSGFISSFAVDGEFLILMKDAIDRGVNVYLLYVYSNSNSLRPT